MQCVCHAAHIKLMHTHTTTHVLSFVRLCVPNYASASGSNPCAAKSERYRV